MSTVSRADSPDSKAVARRRHVALSGQPWLAALLPSFVSVVVAATVFALYFVAQPKWLADPDAQDYAQLGRQIAAGRGPTTAFMPWNGLDYLARHRALPAPFRARSANDAVTGDSSAWPSIARFPLTPALMALAFRVLGPTDEAVHLPAGLAFILTAGAAGWLGWRVYGTWAGLTAGLATGLFPVLVNYSLTGLTEPMLGLLLLAVLACLMSASGTAGRRLTPRTNAAARRGAGARTREGGAGHAWLVAGGLLFGLAILNRYDSALLIVPILSLWLLPRPDRWRSIGLFGVAALVTVLPWSAYLTAVAGTPLFNLQPASIAAQASGRANGLGWYLPEYIRPVDVWLEQPARSLEFMMRELLATPNHLRKLLAWPWAVAGLVAVVAAFARALGDARTPGASGAGRTDDADREGENRLGGGRLVLFLLAAVVLRALLAAVLGLNLQRHYVSLLPLLLVVIAGEADWLARILIRRLAEPTRGRSTLRQSPCGPSAHRPPVHASALMGVRVAVLLLLLGPSLWTIGPYLVPPDTPHAPPTRSVEVEPRPANLARLRDLVGPTQLVASNVPWSVAWQADRRAVPLPPTVEQTPLLEQHFGISIDAIYVAAQVSIADAPRSWRTWEERRRQGTPPPGYVLAESFPNGARLFVKARSPASGSRGSVASSLDSPPGFHHHSGTGASASAVEARRGLDVPLS